VACQQADWRRHWPRCLELKWRRTQRGQQQGQQQPDAPARPHDELDGAAGRVLQELWFLAQLAQLFEQQLPALLHAQRQGEQLLQQLARLEDGVPQAEGEQREAQEQAARQLLGAFWARAAAARQAYKQGGQQAAAGSASAQQAADVAAAPSRAQSCGGCGRRGSDTLKLQLCARCMQVGYCCRRCQTLAWGTHKLVCGV
jgi:hypothetical protein